MTPLKPFTLAQITDTHLLDHPSAQLRGCFTWRTLKTVLDHVSSEPIHSLFLTGDLADQGSLPAYQLLKDLIVPLQHPTYWVLGNHDHLESTTKVLTHPLFQTDKAFTLEGWRLILLNSVHPTARWGEGYLRPQELSRLEVELNHSQLPTLITLHHYVLPTGIDWLDQIRLQNADQFISVIDRYPQVRVILSGHVHLASHQIRNRVHFYTTPSTCLQVMPTDHGNGSELDWPGYRLLTLYPDGEHQTWVRRVPVHGEG